MKSTLPELWSWEDPLDALREVLARGGLVAVPTESSYGLAVDPLSAAGVRAVFRFKRRPVGKSLPVVLGELRQLARLGGDPREPLLARLAALWPAPLSVVTPISRPIPAAPGGRVAVRVPAHDQLRSLLLALGSPLTATSANRGGEPPTLTAGDTARLLAGEDALVVDGGDLPGGEPSTLVEPGGTSPAGSSLTILRRGSYPLERLAERLPELDLGQPFSAATAEILAEK